MQQFATCTRKMVIYVNLKIRDNVSVSLLYEQVSFSVADCLKWTVQAGNIFWRNKVYPHFRCDVVSAWNRKENEKKMFGLKGKKYNELLLLLSQCSCNVCTYCRRYMWKKDECCHKCCLNYKSLHVTLLHLVFSSTLRFIPLLKILPPHQFLINFL